MSRPGCSSFEIAVLVSVSIGLYQCLAMNHAHGPAIRRPRTRKENDMVRLTGRVSHEWFVAVTSPTRVPFPTYSGPLTQLKPCESITETKKAWPGSKDTVHRAVDSI